MRTAYFQTLCSFPVNGAPSLQDTTITSPDWLEKLERYFSHYSKTVYMTLTQIMAGLFFSPTPGFFI